MADYFYSVIREWWKTWSNFVGQQGLSQKPFNKDEQNRRFC